MLGVLVQPLMGRLGATGGDIGKENIHVGAEYVLSLSVRLSVTLSSAISIHQSIYQGIWTRDPEDRK